MNIIALTEKALEEKNKTFLQSEFNFDQLLRFVRRQCEAFPDDAVTRADIFRRGRAAKKERFLEATISAKHSKLGHGGHKRDGRSAGKLLTIHRRIIKGTLHEMAEEALATIIAAKRICEILTVLEGTTRMPRYEGGETIHE